MRPKPTQSRLNTISKGFSGFVGTVLTSNRRKPYSIVDRIKPFNYLYDVIWDRTMRLIANNVGKVGVIDMSSIPSKFTPEQYLNIIRNENLMFKDPFNEGKRGAATGKLSGNMQQSHGEVDLDLSAGIKLYTDMLQWIINTMSAMVGITPQRLGDISSSETVGGVERAVTQSSHITAELNYMHDDTKIRCAQALLECIKIAMRGKNKKIRFVTDEGIHRIIEIAGDDLYNKDHGIFLENEVESAGIKQEIKQLAFAWAQNETVLPDTIMKILTSPSLTDIQRKIETDIEIKAQREQEAQEQAQQSQEKIAQQQVEMQARAQEIQELQIEFNQFIQKYKIDQDNNTKLQIALIGKEGDYSEEDSLDFEKLQLQRVKISNDFEIKGKELAERVRNNKAKEDIARSKPVKNK